MTQTQYTPSVQEPGTFPAGDDAVRDTVRRAYSEAITRVALELGYGSPSAFIAMFRRCVGTTPTDYLAR